MSAHEPVSDAALDQIFRNARSFNGWQDKPVSDVQIAAIYDLMKMGPTAANSHPGRFVWCKSTEAKQKLADCAAENNKTKVLTAPVCVIVGMDNDFHEQLPWLFPHVDAKSWFDGQDAWRAENAMRNASLQGAYLMLAARSLGLDCGPMSGFDPDAVNKAFFADTPNVVANFICSIGYGDPASIFDRSPRPDFGAFNTIL
ncbi:MAG: malonic semialdehyde reductase [Novosphingobium sp.]|nr:malonic semialdehyde reductase [Novosphingobium sp.]